MELFQTLNLINKIIHHSLWIPAGLPELSESNDYATAASSLNSTVHQSYWVLSTIEVTAFIFSSLNQWVLCLKALTSHACQGFEELMIVFPSSQMQHRVMISIILHTIIMVFSEADLKTVLELWWILWTLQQQKLQQNQQNGKKNNDENRELKLKVSLSFGFSNAVK